MKVIRSVILKLKAPFDDELYTTHRSPYSIQLNISPKSLRPLAALMNSEVSFSSFETDIDNLSNLIRNKTFQYNDLYMLWQEEALSSYGFVSSDSKYILDGGINPEGIIQVLVELREILTIADEFTGSIKRHRRIFRLCPKLEFKASA